MLEGASGMLERGGKKTPEIDQKQIEELHAKIGDLATANDFFCPESSSRGPASETEDS
ncbi:MAG: hypothetical protein AAGM12_10075 [Pseudomonadota bacterium]